MNKVRRESYLSNHVLGTGEFEEAIGFGGEK
jgi:hypothetical protein